MNTEGLPDTQTVRLDNLVRVVCVPDMASDVVVVTAAAFAGFRDEEKDEEGFAHLVEHLLCAEAIDDQHFWVGRTMEDCTVLRAVIFPHQLDDAVADLADRLHHRPTEDLINRHQAVIADELRILSHGRNGEPRLPELTAGLLFNAAGTPSSPYAQSAPGLTPERVARFQDRHYNRGPMCVVVRGPIEFDAVASAVLRFMPPLSPLMAPAAPSQPCPCRPHRVIVHVPAQSTAAAACLGILVPTDDDLATMARVSVLADLLSQLSTPDLYHPVARFGAFGPALALRRPGSFTLTAPTDPEWGDEEICGGFLRLLRQIAAGSTDPEQVSVATRRRAGTIRQALHSLWDGPLLLAAAELNYGGAEAAVMYGELLERVNAEALATVAQGLLHRPMTVVIASANAQ